MNSPEKKPGIAKTDRSIIAKTGYPCILNQELPPRISAKANKIIIQIPLLNEDTDPSTIPIRKKTTVMMQINASKPHKTQNSFNFKNNLLLLNLEGIT